VETTVLVSSSYYRASGDAMLGNEWSAVASVSDSWIDGASCLLASQWLVYERSVGLTRVSWIDIRYCPGVFLGAVLKPPQVSFLLG
jgi:hypothetical protein